MATEEEKAKAKERLLQLIPNLLRAVEEAKNSGLAGEPKVGIFIDAPDDQKLIVCQLDALLYLRDMAAVIDAPPLEEKKEARVLSILDHLKSRRPQS